MKNTNSGEVDGEPRVLHIMHAGTLVGGASQSGLQLCGGLAGMGRYDIQTLVPTSVRHVRDADAFVAEFERYNIRPFRQDVPWMAVGATQDSVGRVKYAVKAALYPWRCAFADCRVARTLRDEKIRLVHIGDGVVATGARPAHEADIPLVWHLREYVERDHGLRYINRRRAFDDYALADRIICVSEALSGYYRGLLPHKDIVTIYNGVMPLGDMGCADTIRGDGPWRFVTFGGVRRTKGTFELLEALLSMTRFGSTDFTLDIYGSATESELKELDVLVCGTPLEQRVSYRGWQVVDSELMGHYDVAFTCSRFEAFGRVTAEAMCRGLLVIGADTGGTAELLAEGRGVLYRQGDLASLRGAIEDVRGGVVDMSDIVNRAYRFARENFSVEGYVSKVAEVYDTLL